MLALTAANLKMMARNRHTTFWALFFPLLLVAVFGLFDIDRFGSANLAFIDQADTPRSRLLEEKLSGLEFLKLDRELAGVADARQRLSEGSLDYLLVVPPGFGLAQAPADPLSAPYLILADNAADRERNQLVEGSIKSLVAETGVAEGAEPRSLNIENVQVHRASYFDVVLMGLIGLGIMTNSIISIAVKISTYRNQSILKRMLVTPLAIWKYFAAEVIAHLALALLQAAIILAVGVFVFGARVPGNVAWVFVVVLLGSLVFLNIGFIISAWTNTPSAASGMGNAIALPMMFFAGAFFSTASLPWILPQAVQALPLTPMLSALREVGIESAPLWETWPQLAALAGWVAATSLVAVKVFRFS